MYLKRESSFMHGGNSKFRINNPIPLTHKTLNSISFDNFLLLEKTDGIFKRVERGGCVLDAEELDGILYCFDALVINGRNIMRKTYVERMKLAKKFIKEKDIKVKSFQRVNNLEEVLRVVDEEREHTDGVILQENTQYDKARIYKVKPTRMNTVDFYLKWHEGMYLLYLKGEFNTSSVQEKYPKIPGLSLFVSPYASNSWEWRGEEGMDGKVVELSWDGREYSFHKVREDKVFPNNYYVGVSNLSLVFSPLSEHSIPERVDIPKSYREVCRKAREVIMKNIKEHAHGVSCLNIGAGRGGDVFYLYDIGFRNFFCVDIDRPSLTWCVENIWQRKLRDVYLSIIDYDMRESMEKLMKKLMERADYPEKFDFILMNYSIQHFKENFEEIAKFVRSITRTFAFTYFDGTYIAEHAEEEYDIYPGGKREKIVIHDDGTATFPMLTTSTGYIRENILMRSDLEVFGEKFTEYRTAEEGYYKLVYLRVYEYE